MQNATPVPSRKPGAGSRSEGWLAAFKPNRQLRPTGLNIIVAVEVAIFLAVWVTSPFKVLPRPMEVLSALQMLWTTQGLGHEMGISFGLNIQALAWSTLIALGMAYLSVVPIFRPLTLALSKGRFLSLAGFTVVFTITLGSGHALKLWLMVVGVTVFYVTSMASVVASIPKEKFDHARTLRMSEWRVVWEVVVLGTAEQAFEVLRQNAAIGWMMLTMVEGMVRSEGGVGGMLLSQQKYFRLDSVFAIQLVILTVGLLQDTLITFVRGIVCPYANLTLERK